MSITANKRILFFMNRWLSTAGGIQTVNRELACAIAKQNPAVDCIAVVTFADDAERNHARDNNIQIIAGESEADWESVLLSKELASIPTNEVVAVIGHSYFSGDQAINFRNNFFPNALSVHFVHMSPLDTESLKEYRADIYVKERERRVSQEIQIAQRADLVACIGPRLWSHMKDQLYAKRINKSVARIDCGLKRLIGERTPPTRPSILCLGRTDSIFAKGLDIFALAAGYITKIWSENPATKRRQKPTFIVRGAKEEPENLEKRLIDISKSAGVEATIRVRPYTADLNQLTADYLNASIFMMPSREEGFGLVACEALSQGTPVLISKESGLADAIFEMAYNTKMSVRECVVDHMGDADRVAKRYAKAAIEIFSNEGDAADYTRKLFERLYRTCSWETAARELIKIIKMPTSEKSMPSKVFRTSPTNIPRSPTVGFVVRRNKEGQDILRLLKTYLTTKSSQLVALWGPGGTGKTTLAAEAARALKKVYRNRLVWIDVENHAGFTFFTFLDEIARQLDHPRALNLIGEPKIEDVCMLITSAPTLIVLDNFEILSAAEGKCCVEFLERQSPHSALIVTRQRVEHASSILMDGLSPPESQEFLQRLIKASPNPEILASLDPMRIIEAGGSNPLVMQWVVAQIDLAQNPADVLESLGHGEGEAAQRVFDRSFNLEQVGDDGRAILLALSLFVPSASRVSLAEVAGFGGDVRRLNGAVKRLASLLLITPVDSGTRLSIKGLTRELSKARFMKDSNADEFYQRFVTHYFHYAQAHSRPTPENFRALELEKDNLFTAINVAFQRERWEDVIEIANTLEADGVRGLLPTRGYWDEALVLVDKTITAARKLNKGDVEAQFIHNKAYIRRYSGLDYKEVELLYDQSLRMAEHYNNRSLLGLVLHEKAALYDGDDSRRLYERSLEIKRDINDEAGIGYSLFELGKLDELRGNTTDAKHYYIESLDIARRCGDERGEATVLQQMAWLEVGWLDRNNFDEARRLYQQALKIWEKWDDTKNAAYVTRKLGRLEIDAGNQKSGQKLLKRSLKLNRKLKYQLGISKCLYELGRLAQLQDRITEARQLIEESLDVGSEFNSRRDVAITKRRLAKIIELQGNYPEAKQLFEEVLHRLKEISAPNEEVEGALLDIERLNGKLSAH